MLQSFVRWAKRRAKLVGHRAEARFLPLALPFGVGTSVVVLFDFANRFTAQTNAMAFGIDGENNNLSVPWSHRVPTLTQSIQFRQR